MNYKAVQFTSVWTLIIVLSISRIIYAQVLEESEKYKNKADYYLRRGHLKEALEYYRESLIAYPDQPDIYLTMGQIYEFDLKELEKAIFYYQKYLEFNPKGKDAEHARLFIEKQGKRGVYSKQYPQAFDIIDTPLSSQSEASGLSQAQSSEQHFIEGTIKFTLKEKIMKYQIKINIWKEKGFIQKFNELARMRACPLEIDIAAKRQALREERDEVTKNIDYRQEAIKEIKIHALLKTLSSLGIDLNRYPDELKPDEYIKSYTIVEEKEDKRFFHLTVEFTINSDKLKKNLKKAGFEERPREIAISLKGIEPQLRDTLENFLFIRSKYTAILDDGPRKIYTSSDLFSEEIAKMRIGPYSFIPRSVSEDMISLEVEKEDL
ncbi:MAG: tetratricopeptide repeat protein [bacterium]